MDTFTQAYIECALWSSLDEDDCSLDKNYGVEDIAPETLEKMKKDCADFQAANAEDISANLSLAGHDFWLSRNRHGAGFFDGDWPNGIGDNLQKVAEDFGECDLYVGDDGKIYQE